MARLYRPHVPLSIRVQVAERQLSVLNVNPDVRTGSLKLKLGLLLQWLADSIGCDVKDLRLDHDPPLAARVQERRGLSRKVFYTPDANDPNHLAYRPQGPQYAGSHDVKTRIRGDHGQYSDIQLIKRERRRQKKAEGKPKKKWAPRGKLSTSSRSRFPKTKSRWPKRGFPQRRK